MNEDELAAERLKSKVPNSETLRKWAVSANDFMKKAWKEQEEKFQAIRRPDPANCISCGNFIVKDEHDLLQNGVTLTGSAHYGSIHDLSMIEVVICDACIIKKKVICVPLNVGATVEIPEECLQKVKE